MLGTGKDIDIWQDKGGDENGKIHDNCFSPSCLHLFGGPSSIFDRWRILNHDANDGDLVVGNIIKSMLGLQAEPFGVACNAFMEHGEQQSNKPFRQRCETNPEVMKAMCVWPSGKHVARSST